MPPPLPLSTRDAIDTRTLQNFRVILEVLQAKSSAHLAATHRPIDVHNAKILGSCCKEALTYVSSLNGNILAAEPLQGRICHMQGVRPARQIRGSPQKGVSSDGVY